MWPNLLRYRRLEWVKSNRRGSSRIRESRNEIKKKSSVTEQDIPGFHASCFIEKFSMSKMKLCVSTTIPSWNDKRDNARLNNELKSNPDWKIAGTEILKIFSKRFNEQKTRIRTSGRYISSELHSSNIEWKKEESISETEWGNRYHICYGEKGEKFSPRRGNAE